MRHSAWLRALIGIFGLWFTAALLEAPGVHTCAVHSAASHHHGGSVPMHVASHGAGTGAPASQPPHDASGQCTCLGMCCGASPMASPHVAIRPDRVRLVASGVPAWARETAIVVARPYARPFANGPPTIG